MITMEDRPGMVHFEHDGVKYDMTEKEIEAAYRYREHQCRLEDAKRQLNIVIFGYDDADPEDPEFSDDLKQFEQQYSTSYEEAAAPDMLEEYLRRYESRFDCNQSENDQWEAAIVAALEDAKEA